MPTPKDGEEWEDRFDNWKIKDMRYARQEIKSFIREKIAQAKEEARVKAADAVEEAHEIGKAQERERIAKDARNLRTFFRIDRIGGELVELEDLLAMLKNKSINLYEKPTPRLPRRPRVQSPHKRAM